jgi:hypothetical protein
VKEKGRKEERKEGHEERGALRKGGRTSRNHQERNTCWKEGGGGGNKITKEGEAGKQQRKVYWKVNL